MNPHEAHCNVGATLCLIIIITVHHLIIVVLFGLAGQVAFGGLCAMHQLTDFSLTALHSNYVLATPTCQLWLLITVYKKKKRNKKL